jgi:hypothetical protein
MRSRQEMAKRRDYALYRLGKRFDAPRLNVQSQASRGRFFFSSDQLPAICRELRWRFPERVKEIQDAAEEICAHRFNLLGYENLNYGPQIDWHVDLVHSKRAPRKPWFKIRYLDFDEVGDSKITWELNRHQFLVTLAKAYLLTEDTRYAEELLCLWNDWCQKNPYPIGINWASSLELAFRSLSWIWAFHLLQSSAVMPQSFAGNLTAALALHGRHIETYLSTYFSPNTHLLGEGVALFFLGTLYPAIPEARRWKNKGWQIVLQEAARQVQPDGMHFEQSLHYHVYAVDFFLHARILAVKNQMAIPPEFDKTIVKMLEVLCTLSQAGTLPHFGDDDGGRVFDPARNRVEHFLDPLCTGAILFGRGDFKAAGKLCEETLWLLGEEGIAQFDSLAETKPKASAALPSSGIYVMADRSANQQLIIDAGSLGTGRAGHGHADALSLQLSIDGREFLSDPGTFSYVSADIDRNRFRGTGAHNTLRIDGGDQAEPDGPFGWHALPRVSVETWQNTNGFDLLSAQAAYQQLKAPAVHQRTIFYLKPRFWFVRDVVTGAGEHRLELSWHFPPKLDIQTLLPGSFAIRGDARHQCLALLAAENQGAESRVEEDDWSPSYGKLVQSSAVRVTREGPLPAEFATILLPASAADSDFGHLNRTNFGHNSPTFHSYAYSAMGETHYFFFDDSGLKWNAGVWSSNARFFYCATAPTGEPLHWIISRGSFLAMDNRPLLEEKQAVEWREWKKSSASTQQETSEEADKVLQRTMTEKTNKAGDR